MTQARALVASGVPSDIQGGNLLAALHRLPNSLHLDGIRLTTALPARLPPLPSTQQVALLRTAQEALNNVRRHSGATAAELLVEAPADGIDVVAAAANGQEAVDAVSRLRPAVVLMDLRMPVLDGAGATAQIRDRFPDTKVLVLTTYDDDSDIMRAVESGAVGYLLKDTPGDRIIEAVRAAARGETVLAPPVAARLVSRMRSPELPRLTAREVEVLRCVAQGLSNPEAAARLHIAEATVKTHLLRIFTKLDVDDRTRAVVLAMERGLL